MPAAARRWNDVSLGGLCDDGWRRLCQPNLCLAAEWAKATTYAVEGCESPVEHWDAINATIANPRICNSRPGTMITLGVICFQQTDDPLLERSHSHRSQVETKVASIVTNVADKAYLHICTV